MLKNKCAIIVFFGSVYSALSMEKSEPEKIAAKLLDNKNLPLVAKLQDAEIVNCFGRDATRIIHARAQALRNKIDTNAKNIRSKNNTDLRSIDESFVHNFQAGLLISVLAGNKPKNITEMHTYHKRLFSKYPHIVLIDKFKTPIMRAYKVNQESEEIINNLKFDFDVKQIARDFSKIRAILPMHKAQLNLQTYTQQDGKSPKSEQ